MANIRGGLSRTSSASIRNDPSALRWLIGVELANFRKQAAISTQDVVEGTGIGKPKLSSMENGRYHQHPDDIAKLLTLYGAAQRDIDSAPSPAVSPAAPGGPPWSHVVPDWVKTFVGLEGLADSEFVFEPMLVPGLLQTEDYAQAITEATGFVRRDHHERFVSFRQARAQRLADDNPLALHAIIGEAALRLNVGTPEIRREQCRHLLALAKLTTVTIQDDVHTYRMAVENLQSVALAPAKSIALIRSLTGAG
jgi:hypothetical protein